MKFLNFGMDNPLTLSMAHPLAERVETIGHKTARASVSRSAACAIIVGGALITAPLTLASDNAPNPNPSQQNEELAGAASNGEKKFVFKTSKVVKIDNEDGQLEVIGENGKVQAFRIDENGVKTEIDPSEIDSISVEMLDNLDGLEDLSGLGNLAGLESLKELEGMKIFLSDTGSLNGLDSEKLEEIIEKAISGTNVEGFEFDGTNQAYVERLKALEGSALADTINGKMQIIIKGGQEAELKGLLDGAAHMIESAQKASQSVKNAEQDLSRVERELAKALKALQKAEKALAEEQAK